MHSILRIAALLLIASPVAAQEEGSVFRFNLQAPILFGSSGDSSTPPAGPPTEVGRRQDAPESVSCGAEFSGLQTRTRDIITWSDGSETATEWSEWNREACTSLVVSTSYTERQYDYSITGTQYCVRQRDRTITIYADYTVSYAAWPNFPAYNCFNVPTTTAPGRTQSYGQLREKACPAGQVGFQADTRTVTYTQYGSMPTYSAWQQGSAFCTTP